VNYWIFTVNNDKINGIRKDGAEIYSQRMKDRFWGLKENVNHRNSLSPEDEVLYYLAGSKGQVFLGTATLDSGFFKLSRYDRKIFWHGPFFESAHGVRLKNVQVWRKTKSIRPLIRKLEFISVPEKWGVSLHHSVVSVSKKDFDLIVGKEKQKKDVSPPSLMLKVIENRKEIADVQELFIEKLNSMADKSGIIFLGYRGGSEKLEAFWSKKLDIWWVTSTSGNRFWNAFGLGEPKWESRYSHHITCEINPPFQGINRSISGVFAKNYNNLYLLHRGSIGGGRKDVGKKVFKDQFRGEWQIVEDGDRISNIALIGSFGSSRFPEQIATFVKEVARIKSEAAKGTCIKLPETKIKNIIFKELPVARREL